MMKRFVLLLIVFLIICGSCIATIVGSDMVRILGKIENGFSDDTTPGNNGLYIDVKLLKGDSVDSDIAVTAPIPVEFSESGKEYVQITGVEDNAIEDIQVDVDHSESENIDSFTIVYGAHCNIAAGEKGTAGPSLSITASSGGWEIKGAEGAYVSATDTMRLEIAPPVKADSATDGKITAQVSSNALSVTASPGAFIAQDSPVLVGYSTVTWGPKENKTPLAGDYQATITIDITTGD